MHAHRPQIAFRGEDDCVAVERRVRVITAMQAGGIGGEKPGRGCEKTQREDSHQTAQGSEWKHSRDSSSFLAKRLDRQELPQSFRGGGSKVCKATGCPMRNDTTCCQKRRT